MIVFGGWKGLDRTHETLAFELQGGGRWTQVASEEEGPPSLGGLLVYDPARDQVLLAFKPSNSPVLNLWSLALNGKASWSKVLDEGDLPSFGTFPYAGAALVYDVYRDRFLLVISHGLGARPLDGIYDLTFRDDKHARWKRLTSSLPEAVDRVGFGLVHDLADDRLILFGGGKYPSGCFDLDDCIRPLSDTWTVSLRDTTYEWTQLVPSGVAPEARSRLFSAYDAKRHRMLIYGGNARGARPLFDTWALTLGEHPEWNELADAFPHAPTRESVIWDSDRERLVQFGGIEPVTRARPFNVGGEIGLVRELSVASGVSWETVYPGQPVPSPRSGHTLTYDPSGRQWILFGGAEDDSTVWILSDRGRAAWRVLSTRGETPSPRAFHSAAYDSASHSVLIYGGVSLRTLRFFDDVWRLSLTNPPTWTRVDPVSAGPGKRAWHGAVLDPAGQRMLVFGGRDSTSHATDELWQLSLGESPTWAQIETQGESPGPMADLSFLYDTNRGRAILVSGSSGARDVWSLNLSGTPRWTLIAQNGPLVSRNGATFDAVGDRILALNATFLFKPWELPLSGPAEWRAIPVGGDAPSPRQAPIACNSRGDEIAMFGGSDGQGLNLSDLWILSLPRNASTTLRPRAGAREINFGQVSLAPPHPNPSRSGVSFAYTQPASAYVKISVFDGAGRLVRNLFDGASEEGSHEVSWDGMQQGGSRARAGVYYCAMTIGGQTLSRKFVLISP